ncbi:hypothetical protein SLEP1_g42123 [Rubroshorea leprosula]|uniref:Phytocyanin domain-containing protein n=1 Tax=Rubroshorea leprosula TaxID=152421 RepID=A0AAV5L8S6_9ROSI|nr:hypothetical protein SLEP1_g42123 [Rubroshorea leprosula]
MAGLRGSVTGIACVLLALCMAVPTLATVYTVGDSSGWATGVDYTTWAKGKTFAVGDSLVFNYGGGAHTVDEVNASDYNTCTVGNYISTDQSGATTIPLKTAGTHYFICGVTGHCGSGMKLAVDVAAAAAPSGTPSSSGTPPATNTTVTTPTPVTTKPTTTVPSSSGAVSSVEALVMTMIALFVLVVS